MCALHSVLPICEDAWTDLGICMCICQLVHRHSFKLQLNCPQRSWPSIYLHAHVSKICTEVLKYSSLAGLPRAISIGLSRPWLMPV